MRLYDERRRIDVLATVLMPILALAAAVVTAFLAGCTGPVHGEPHTFLARAIHFVPDEGALPGHASLQLAGVDLEQNRFALRVAGIETAEAAGHLSFNTEVARLDHVASKLHFVALTPGATRIELIPEDALPIGGTLVVE
jgi:hypothetical protein